MRRKFRTRLLVDGPLQGALVCRVMLYWSATAAVMLLLAGLQAAWANHGTTLPVLLNRASLAFGPALLASLVLLPMVLFDVLRFSHRFAGPMHRLRRETQRLADGESIKPIAFRPGDYWGDLAADFNRVADQLQALRATQAGGADPDPADDVATTEVLEVAGAPGRDEPCGV